jgi:hypothetical protein
MHLDRGHPALSDPSSFCVIHGDDTKYIGREAELQSGSRREHNAPIDEALGGRKELV